MPRPPTLLTLIGPPAAGKSTLMAALTASWAALPRPTAPVPHILYLDPRNEVVAVEVGGLRPGFPGTDTLHMAIIDKAITWTQGHPAPLLLMEGSRLAVRRYLQAATDSGYRAVVALLDTEDQDELDRRCAQRGSRQSPAWRQGQTTRARVLHRWAAAHPACTAVRLDATAPTTALAEQLRKEIP